MGVLDGFTPEQKKMAMIGAPVVAGVALVSVLRGKKTSAPAASADPNQAVGGRTDAIGVSQLAEFESGVTDSLNQLWRQWEAGKATANTTPATPTYDPSTAVGSMPAFETLPPPPAPAPSQYVSPAPSIQTTPGYQLPDATGTGQRYVTPDGYSFTYG